METNINAIIIFVSIFFGIVFLLKILFKALFKGFSPEIFIGQKALESQGIDVSSDDLKLHRDAGGNVMNVVKKIIEAKQMGKDMPFQEACALDLAEASGLDIDELRKNNN